MLEFAVLIFNTLSIGFVRPFHLCMDSTGQLYRIFAIFLNQHAFSYDKMPFIALFTDFGWKGQHYIAEMMGVIYSINPNVTIINGYHGIQPYSISEAQYILETSVHTFPPNTIIICVVDPGVGTKRKILAVRRQNGQILIGPDNGIFSGFLFKETCNIYSIENEELFYKGTDGQISASFHGRDIMAPTAAQLSKGFPLDRVGPLVEMPVLVPKPTVEWQIDRVDGHVLYVDDFGNIITNISTLGFTELYQQPLTMNDIPIRFVSNFLEGKENEVLLMGGSSGYLEIVMNQRNAAECLNMKQGDSVKILSIPKHGTSEEILACFHYPDIKEFHTGKFSKVFPYPRKAAHAKRIPHFICRIFLFTSDKKYLVQQRNMTRSSHPGKLTDSASGHLRYRNPFTFEAIEQDMLREVQEEMGVVPYYFEFLDLSMEKYIHSEDVELSFNFIGLCHESFVCDPVECGSRSGFYTKEQMQEMFQREEWVPFALLYWNKIINEHLDDKIIENYNRSGPCPCSDQDPRPLGTGMCEANILSDSSVVNSIGTSRSIKFNQKITIVNKVGAFIGRFQPFHLGHLHCILEALKYVKVLKIGIGSSQYSNTSENPFDYQTRKMFVEEALKEAGIFTDRFEIFAIPDIHDSERWAKHFISIVGDFDFFFSNSDWTRSLIAKEGKAVWKKIPFEMEKYNGTLIRTMIANNQDISDYLPKSVVKILKAVKNKETK